VDDNYRSLKQVNVNTIRQKRKDIYWLLIWYFCTVKLPYEFLIPYEEKELDEEFTRQYLSVRRQMYFDEKVEYYGLGYFD
jgi:protein-S-isoprenylcysteine O-methyltransferase Ste14